MLLFHSMLWLSSEWHFKLIALLSTCKMLWILGACLCATFLFQERCPCSSGPRSLHTLSWQDSLPALCMSSQAQFPSMLTEWLLSPWHFFFFNNSSISSISHLVSLDVLRKKHWGKNLAAKKWPTDWEELCAFPAAENLGQGLFPYMGELLI